MLYNFRGSGVTRVSLYNVTWGRGAEKLAFFCYIICDRSLIVSYFV